MFESMKNFGSIKVSAVLRAKFTSNFIAKKDARLKNFKMKQIV